eukprot:1160796-Pelagomonas_calceolata.AAC.4
MSQYRTPCTLERGEEVSAKHVRCGHSLRLALSFAPSPLSWLDSQYHAKTKAPFCSILAVSAVPQRTLGAQCCTPLNWLDNTLSCNNKSALLLHSSSATA